MDPTELHASIRKRLHIMKISCMREPEPYTNEANVKGRGLPCWLILVLAAAALIALARGW